MNKMIKTKQSKSRKAGAKRVKNTFTKKGRQISVFSQLLNLIKKGFLPSLCLALGLSAGVYLFPLLTTVFNPVVEKVIVSGDFLYLEKQEVVDNVDIYTESRLFDVDLDRVQSQLETMPWVFSAQVLRKWPGKIVINVQEQTPIAKWNQDFLLNQYGVLFARQGKVVRAMPALSGSSDTALDGDISASGADQVLQRYQEFSSLLTPYGLQMVSLQQDARGGWSARLNNQTELVLGRDDVLKKMRHFIVLYEQQLQLSTAVVDSVDLRYGNGAAVKWKKQNDAETIAARG